MDEHGKMSLEDFKEQIKFCGVNCTPEGPGCIGCPGEDGVCADNILNIMGQWKDQRCYLVQKEHPGYTVSIELYGFDRDVLNMHRIGMENPDNYEVISEQELYKRLTEAV